MAEKSYYYLKLKDTFFDSDEMKILESMENGYLYSNILLKLYLKSLKLDGKLMFNEYIPYDSKMLATITGHNIDVVEKAIVIFKQLQLIEILDNGAIYMLNIQNMIGSISTEGVRKAEYRQKIKLEKENKKQIGTNMGQCPDIISISNSISNSNINNIEEKDNKENITKEIIDYLNSKLGTNYRASTKSTISFINARIKEGYTLEDFKLVIDKKYKEWKGTQWEKYLTPETLFRPSNFEKYLNQKIISENNAGFMTREYTKEEFEALYDSLDDIEI